MGRRTSGQTTGLQSIGNVQASAATLTTSQSNQDLTLDPNGTGGIIINGDVTIANQADLRLRESSGNGTNYIALQAAATMAADYTITWPAAVSAAAGYVLSSDTSGNLSWINPSTFGLAGSDPGASATVYYPFFGTASGSIPTGTITTVNARSNLSFVPSTGELTATAYLGANLYGSTGSGGTLTLRGTTNATKAAASILITESVASTSKLTGALVVTGGVGITGDVYGTNAVFSGKVNSVRTESDKTSSYTLALVDQDTVVSFSGSSPQTVTVPNDSVVNFPVGSVIYLNRIGTGTLSLVGAAGVTMTKTGSFAQYEEIYVRKRGANSWLTADAPQALSATGGTVSTGGGFTIRTFTSSGSLVVG
jgi:hypothetical protein